MISWKKILKVIILIKKLKISKPFWEVWFERLPAFPIVFIQHITFVQGPLGAGETERGLEHEGEGSICHSFGNQLLWGAQKETVRVWPMRRHRAVKWSPARRKPITLKSVYSTFRTKVGIKRSSKAQSAFVRQKSWIYMPITKEFANILRSCKILARFLTRSCKMLKDVRVRYVLRSCKISKLLCRGCLRWRKEAEHGLPIKLCSDMDVYQIQRKVL